MRRRTFIQKSAIGAMGVGTLGASNWGFIYPEANAMTVSSLRIEERIAALAVFGRDANGHGYRVGYTKGDIEGRTWFIELMKKAGLEISIDTAGNIIGKREGKNASLKPICFGSHIDMVPDGGNYDGTLGSIGALEVVDVLNENKVTTEHPLEVIIFSNEEGGTIGSKAMSGQMTADGLKQASQSGLTMAEGIKAIGGNPERIQDCVRKKGDIHAFVELHIEQGGLLEKENLQIGVVEGIVGIVRWEVTVEGFANHAGTTPMNLRQDALLASSKVIIAVNEVVSSVPGNQVANVGRIAVAPGAYNVIPGKVVLGLEMRDLSTQKIDMLFGEIEKRAATIATDSKTKIGFVRQANEVHPAFTDKGLQQTIDKTAKSLGLKTKFMQSGAGHDSQEISLIAPVAMIFVPSVGGISHSPKEFTKTLDMANGVNVLLQTILAIDRG